MIDNLSVGDHVFPMPTLTSLSIDRVLLPRSLNWTTYFNGLPFKMERAISRLKQTILPAFRWRSWPLAAELKRLWNMWVSVIPMWIDILRTVPKRLAKRLEGLEISVGILTFQITTVLRSAKILRSVMGT